MSIVVLTSIRPRPRPRLRHRHRPPSHPGADPKRDRDSHPHPDSHPDPDLSSCDMEQSDPTLTGSVSNSGSCLVWSTAHGPTCRDHCRDNCPHSVSPTRCSFRLHKVCTHNPAGCEHDSSPTANCKLGPATCTRLAKPLASGQRVDTSAPISDLIEKKGLIWGGARRCG